MRRTALLGPLLGIVIALPGCVGAGDFLNNTLGSTNNPNMPMGDSLNMRRVQGQSVETTPITPQAGNVWPRGVDPLPTLQDVENERGMAPMRPVTPPRQGQSQIPGSSTPPAQASVAPVTPLPAASAAAPTTTATPLAAMPALPPMSIPTNTGTGIVATGTDRYQTVSTPTGTAVVVPNGNGTATLMRADGTMEVVTVPR